MMAKQLFFHLASFILFLNSNGCSPASDSQALPENRVNKHIEQRLEATPVRHLAIIDTLRQQFQADSGNVRIISILSPT